MHATKKMLLRPHGYDFVRWLTQRGSWHNKRWSKIHLTREDEQRTMCGKYSGYEITMRLNEIFHDEVVCKYCRKLLG